jgi:hypothetical protein
MVPPTNPRMHLLWAHSLTKALRAKSSVGDLTLDDKIDVLSSNVEYAPTDDNTAVMASLDASFHAFCRKHKAFRDRVTSFKAARKARQHGM